MAVGGADPEVFLLSLAQMNALKVLAVFETFLWASHVSVAI